MIINNRGKYITEAFRRILAFLIDDSFNKGMLEFCFGKTFVIKFNMS